LELFGLIASNELAMKAKPSETFWNFHFGQTDEVPIDDFIAKFHANVTRERAEWPNQEVH
jgi:hypothetical protein